MIGVFVFSVCRQDDEVFNHPFADALDLRDLDREFCERVAQRLGDMFESLRVLKLLKRALEQAVHVDRRAIGLRAGIVVREQRSHAQDPKTWTAAPSLIVVIPPPSSRSRA